MPEYKEFGFDTEEEYEEFCRIDRCLSDLFRSDDSNYIGYSHISYEDYMSEYD